MGGCQSNPQLARRSGATECVGVASRHKKLDEHQAQKPAHARGGRQYRRGKDKGFLKGKQRRTDDMDLLGMVILGGTTAEGSHNESRQALSHAAGAK